MVVEGLGVTNEQQKRENNILIHKNVNSNIKVSINARRRKRERDWVRAR